MREGAGIRREGGRRGRCPAFRTAAAGLVAALVAASPAGAATIGYWRMDVDLDASEPGLEVPNEVTGNPMISSEAGLDTGNFPSLPGNQASARPLVSGSSSDGINGQVTFYAALDVSSITVELFARTTESAATLFGRTSGANGIALDSPNALALSYYVDDGLGGGTQVVLANLDDMGTTWKHYAFTYDAATGVGAFYVDGVLVASNDGPDGRSLYWGTTDDLFIGRGLDNSGNFVGAIDEVRISDAALLPSSMLTPEPASAGLLALGLLGLAVGGRRRG